MLPSITNYSLLLLQLGAAVYVWPLAAHKATQTYKDLKTWHKKRQLLRRDPLKS